ncbi:MAG: precorrin-2 C(20)-methyltransferase [Pseudomonadota bacterium]
MTTGTLFGVGVGPGDPDLLTLKAHRLISGAAVIAYPAPEGGESFARAIVADVIPAGTPEVRISVPMTVARFPAREVYDKAAADIAGHLEAGRDVVVLCEGDPFFYGSFMYLYERLADRYPTEIVPGVSSLMTCAARFGRPLAARNDVLRIIPAPLPEDRLAEEIAASDAAAIIKVGRHYEKVRRVIDRLGLVMCCGYVERASLPAEIVKPLNSVNGHDVPYFSMILLYKGAEEWARAPQLSA